MEKVLCLGVEVIDRKYVLIVEKRFIRKYRVWVSEGVLVLMIISYLLRLRDGCIDFEVYMYGILC